MTKTRFGRSAPPLNGRVGSDASQLPYGYVFVITCRGGEMSPGPTNSFGRCVWRFSTICAKNQVLKLNMDRVTLISVHANSPFWLQDPVVHLPCSTFFSRQKRTHHARHSPDGQRGLSSVYILILQYNTTSDNARNTLLYLAVIPGNHRYLLGIGIPCVKYIAPEFHI